jgi:hypothetical protein
VQYAVDFGQAMFLHRSVGLRSHCTRFIFRTANALTAHALHRFGVSVCAARVSCHREGHDPCVCVAPAYRLEHLSPGRAPWDRACNRWLSPVADAYTSPSVTRSHYQPRLMPSVGGIVHPHGRSSKRTG